MKQNILTFLIIIVLSSFMSYCEEEWADESIDFKVSSVSPGSNSLNVDSGASIIIQFNKSVKTSTFARGFHLSSSDENINLSNYTITWSKSNKKVTLSSPVKLLRTQTTFNITLNSNLKSSAGDGLELYNSVFDTGGARFSYPPTGAYGFNVLSANPNIHYSPSLTFSMKALISGPGIVELFLPLFYTAGTSYGWAPGVRSYYTLTSADMHITVPANGFAANPGPIVISENGVVQKQVYFINPYQFLKKWGSFGTNDYQFGAYYLSIDANNNLYVGDFSNHRILRYNSKGVFTGCLKDGLTGWRNPCGGAGTAGTADGQFKNPRGVVVDSNGNVYVADYSNHRIQKISSIGKPSGCYKDGSFSTSCGGAAGSMGALDGQFSFPIGLAIDSNDNLYVNDSGNNRIQVFNPSGTFIRKWGTSGSGDLQLSWPVGISIDKANNVYVADSSNHRIMKFSSSGVFQGCLKSGVTGWQNPCGGVGTSGTAKGQFNNPEGVMVDSRGNIFVGDSGNHRIQKFDSNGNYSLEGGVAGVTGTGDGQFNFPTNMIIDSGGNLCVLDQNNNRIQVFKKNY